MATDNFATRIASGYATSGAAVGLGRGMLDGATHPDAIVQIPVAMCNRHGLIVGATGTGKTKTLQLLAEQLSALGVPVFAADVKGDLSGLLDVGAVNDKVTERATDLGITWEPRVSTVELYALGGLGPGVPIRAAIASFGPQLLAKVLDANPTQTSSLALVFHYADGAGLPMLDLADLRAVLQFLTSAEGKDELTGIGGLSKATAGVLLRSIVELESQGADAFFGEPELDIDALLRVDADGNGIVSCLELAAVQDRPRVYSTFLMWLLAELFEQLPEVGDLDQPKLVFFFDEAHLLFNDVPKAFLEQVAQTVRLIRSKGVGVFFVTQLPDDVPSDVLAQMGNRIQHALRVFTPRDAKALKAAVTTYPNTDDYDLEEALTQLGTGEAMVTILSGTWHTDAGRVDEDAAAAIVDGRRALRTARRARGGVAVVGDVRRRDRPRVGPRAARREADRRGAGRGAGVRDHEGETEGQGEGEGEGESWQAGRRQLRHRLPQEPGRAEHDEPGGTRRLRHVDEEEMSAVRVGLIGAGPWARAVTGPVFAAGPETQLAGVWLAHRRERRRGRGSARRRGVHRRRRAACRERRRRDCRHSRCPTRPCRARGRSREADAAREAARDRSRGRPAHRRCGRARGCRHTRDADVPLPPGRAALRRSGGELRRTRWARVLPLGALLPGSPYARGWRLERGALLDVGPHLLDLHEIALGEITDIRAAGDRHGWVALTLTHASGATSQASLCCRAAMESRTELELFGTGGSLLFDGREGDRREVGTNMRRAFASVVAGTPHAADARRGLHLQQLIERAEQQL